MSISEAERILAQQELAELKLKRLETLKALSKYRLEHRLESFVPHPSQQRLVDVYKDGKCSLHAVLGGNRSGKSAIGAALTVSIALGRLPWIKVPEPVIVPEPYGVKVFADGSFGAIYPRAQVDALPESERIGWTPHVVETDKSLRTNATKKVGLLIRTFPTDKAFKAWRSELASPTDPGKLRFKPPVKIRIFGEDAKALEQVQIPLIKSLIAPEWIAAQKKNSFGLDGHWLLTNGSTLDFFTYQQEPATFEGWHGHHLWFDEPPPRPVYIANLRGLVDYSGTALFTMTPLKEAWISDQIVNTSDPKIFSMVMTSHENPHISKESIDAFAEALTEEERETRIGGKFLHLQGLVFKEFDKKIHVVPPFKPDRQYTVYVAVDTHPRTEHAITFAAVDRHDRIFIVHEIFKHGSPEQVAAWISEYHKEVHPIEMVIIEPGSKGDTNRGKSTFEVIDDLLSADGIPLELGSKDLEGGINLTRDYFKSRNGQASLFFTENCEKHLWMFQRYVWADWKGPNAGSKNQLNKPKDLDDHFPENVRRLIQVPIRYVNPAHREAMRSQASGYQPLDPVTGY